MSRQSAVEKELRRQIEVIDEEMDALSKQCDSISARRAALFDFRCFIENRLKFLENVPRRKVDSNAPQ